MADWSFVHAGIAAFLAYVTSLEKDKPVVFCGDLNVAHTPDDLANPQSNAGKKGFTDEERQGFQNFLDAGFVDTFRMFHQGNGFYTWWSHFANARTRNVGWRIDYFLVSADLVPRVRTADVHPDIMGSDHCPVSLTLDDLNVVAGVGPSTGVRIRDPLPPAIVLNAAEPSFSGARSELHSSRPSLTRMEFRHPFLHRSWCTRGHQRAAAEVGHHDARFPFRPPPFPPRCAARTSAERRPRARARRWPSACRSRPP